MSSKPGDKLTKRKVLVFFQYIRFIILWSWNIAGIQYFTVRLLHINMKWILADITIRLLHIIMKGNWSDLKFLWRNSLPYWKTKFCRIIIYGKCSRRKKKYFWKNKFWTFQFLALYPQIGVFQIIITMNFLGPLKSL